MRGFACVFVALALSSCAQGTRPYFQYNHVANSARELGNNGLRSFIKASSEEHELPAFASVLDLSRKFSDSNKFILAYNEIKNYPASDRQDTWLKLQMQLTYASFLGTHPDYSELLSHFERPGEKDSIYSTIENKATWDAQVYDKIVDAARGHKIVMFNENHFMPQHRVFVLNLLPRLERLGFNTLALEALFSDERINEPNAFPTLKEGFYTREQNYGHLIRKAKELGFRFVSYDHYDNPKERERSQAENLYNKTFKADPDAKVVVLAGIAHILEKETKRHRKWMAALFKEKYHIDPLTISQTGLNRYRNLFEHELGLVEGASFKEHRLNSVDFLVLNNIAVNRKTDPDDNFSYKNESHAPIQLNLFLRSETQDGNDVEGKIPYRVFYLKPAEQVKLNLPQGKYDLVAFDGTGKTILHRALTVDGKHSHS